MDIQGIRRTNLLHLLHTAFDGNAAELARAISRSNPQVNDLLAGRKSFGEKFARAIEPLLGKDAGWLDTPHSGPSFEPDAGFLKIVAEAASDRDIPDHIKQSIITLISSSPKKTDANR